MLYTTIRPYIAVGMYIYRGPTRRTPYGLRSIAHVPNYPVYTFIWWDWNHEILVSFFCHASVFITEMKDVREIRYLHGCSLKQDRVINCPKRCFSAGGLRSTKWGSESEPCTFGPQRTNRAMNQLCCKSTRRLHSTRANCDAHCQTVPQPREDSYTEEVIPTLYAHDQIALAWQCCFPTRLRALNCTSVVYHVGRASAISGLEREARCGNSLSGRLRV